VTTLAAWTNDLNPIIVDLGGGFAVRWYGVSYILGFVCAWALLSLLARRGTILLSRQAVGDAMLLLVVGVIVGGRLGYVLLYQPALLWSFGGSPPWWGVLMINRGGMASHGGMLGVIAMCWFIARRNKVPMLHVLDAVAVAAPIGLMLGRLANFINGELLGRIVADPGQPAPWWSVRYPNEIVERRQEGLDRMTPEQINRFADLLMAYMPANPDLEDPAKYAAQNVVDAVQRGDPGVKAALEPLLTARHPSQLYQAFAEGLVVLAVLLFIWRKPRKPGVVGCWFLMTYGVGRIATEFYRLPDVGIPRWIGLSRGQWLSVLMILVGAVTLALVTTRSRQPKLGGWLHRAEPSTSAPSTRSE
jgi:phosphatidylglycerol---prolipoprotein diacylglyceryl transferase